MYDDEVIRQGVKLIKTKFLNWCSPPVRLPADHVIIECVEEIIRLTRETK